MTIYVVGQDFSDTYCDAYNTSKYPYNHPPKIITSNLCIMNSTDEIAVWEEMILCFAYQNCMHIYGICGWHDAYDPDYPFLSAEIGYTSGKMPLFEV